MVFFTVLFNRMKITVEIDELKLARVMELGGIRTKTAAIEFALETAERELIRDRLYSVRPTAEELRESVDPAYSVTRLREKERGGK